MQKLHIISQFGIPDCGYYYDFVSLGHTYTIFYDILLIAEYVDLFVKHGQEKILIKKIDKNESKYISFKLPKGKIKVGFGIYGQNNSSIIINQYEIYLKNKKITKQILTDQTIIVSKEKFDLLNWTNKILKQENENYKICQDIEQKIQKYNNYTDFDEINKINNNFTKEIEKYKNILFICSDFPSYGGASTNTERLMKYYGSINHKVFGLFVSDLKFNHKFEIELGSNMLITKFVTDKIINKINSFFDHQKIDLVIIRNFCDHNFCNIEYLKTIWTKSIFYFLVPGIFKDTLDKYVEELDSIEIRKYICPEILNTAMNCDKLFTNSLLTQYLLIKHFNIQINILYFNYLYNQKHNITKYINPKERPFLIGVVISNFNRTIKNVSLIRYIFEKFHKYQKIAIGKNSEILKDIENTTCIGLTINDDVDFFLRNVNIVINTSFYESCSNSLIEAELCGCNVIKHNYFNLENSTFKFPIEKLIYEYKTSDELIEKINYIIHK